MKSPRDRRSPWFLALTLLAPAAAWAQDKAQTTPAPEAKADDAPIVRPNTAIAPEPKPGAWVKRHEAFLDRAKQGDVDVLFLGDSITAGWSGAPAIWSRYYGHRKAANFGIGGDRTQHVLWRLDNGEVQGIKPKVVVLMIGTNNTAPNTEAEVAEGVQAVVSSLRERLPDSKILLLGIFPRAVNRDKTQTSSPPDPKIARINARVAPIADGKTVKYLDIGVHFLDEAGQIPGPVMPDYLHPSRKGYQIWADAIEPTLREMLGE